MVITLTGAGRSISNDSQILVVSSGRAFVHDEFQISFINFLVLLIARISRLFSG